MAAPEEILTLFDSYWFEHKPLAKKLLSHLPNTPRTSATSETQEEITQKPKLSKLPTLHVRSLSDQFLSSTTVLSTSNPKLQTIFSGKEIKSFSEKDTEVENKKVSEKRSRRKQQLGGSKSLSELEFEELKGFMDLGFVFSEEDKNSSLVSMIPGLQRLGIKERDSEEKEEGKVETNVQVVRPYLSESWHGLNEREEKKKLMNWRVPLLGTELDMKDNLKFWAHTVASTVR